MVPDDSHISLASIQGTSKMPWRHCKTNLLRKNILKSLKYLIVMIERVHKNAFYFVDTHENKCFWPVFLSFLLLVKPVRFTEIPKVGEPKHSHLHFRKNFRAIFFWIHVFSWLFYFFIDKYQARGRKSFLLWRLPNWF